MYAGKLSNLAVPLPIRSFSTEVERARRERKRREGESPPASLAMEAVAIKLVAGLAKTAVVTALGSLVKMLKYERALEKSVKDGLRSLKAELMFWSVIQTVSGLYPPTSAANIFENLLCGIVHEYIILLRMGWVALL
jgi:hypothetical protein